MGGFGRRLKEEVVGKTNSQHSHSQTHLTNLTICAPKPAHTSRVALAFVEPNDKLMLIDITMTIDARHRQGGIQGETKKAMEATINCADAGIQSRSQIEPTDWLSN